MLLSFSPKSSRLLHGLTDHLMSSCQTSSTALRLLPPSAALSRTSLSPSLTCPMANWLYWWRIFTTDQLPDQTPPKPTSWHQNVKSLLGRFAASTVSRRSATTSSKYSDVKALILRQSQNPNQLFTCCLSVIKNVQVSKDLQNYSSTTVILLVSPSLRLMSHMQQHVSMMSEHNANGDTLPSCPHCFRHFQSPFKLQCHLEVVHSQCGSTGVWTAPYTGGFTIYTFMQVIDVQKDEYNSNTIIHQ